MTCRRLQRLDLYRIFPAIILSFVIQACLVSGPVGSPISPGSAPAIYPPFDAYDVCIRGTEMEDSQREDCFKQAIQGNHLALPAGTTTEQAFDKYNDCVMKNPSVSVTFGGFTYYGDKQKAVRQNCFRSALQ